jgi:hypothetical protein
MGTRAVLILGDFTAQVGDPSGRRTPAAPVEGGGRRVRGDLRRAAASILLPRPLEVHRNSTVARAHGHGGGAAPHRPPPPSPACSSATTSQAVRERHADLADRVPLPAAPGHRLGGDPGRRRARRHRPAVQQPHGPPAPGAAGPGGPGRAHHATARGARRRAEDVEVARGTTSGSPSRRPSSSASSCRCPTSSCPLLPAHHRLAPDRVDEVVGELASGA